MSGEKVYRVTMTTERSTLVEAPNEGVAVHKAVAWFVDHREERPDIKMLVERETAAKH